MEGPWLDSSLTSWDGWRRGKLPYTCAVRNRVNAQRQYYEDPEYGAAGLCWGGASKLHLASVQPGCVCSSPGPDEQCAETSSLSHRRVWTWRSGRTACCPNYFSVPQAVPPPGPLSSIYLLPGRMPGPDAQVSVHHWPGNSECNSPPSTPPGTELNFTGIWVGEACALRAQGPGQRKQDRISKENSSRISALLFSRSVMYTSLWPHAAHHTSLSFTISWSLLKLMSIRSMMPSNHSILCHPLLLKIFIALQITGGL